MARHNYVNVIAFVRKAPLVKTNEQTGERAAIVGMTTTNGSRDARRSNTGYKLNSVEFIVRSQEPKMVDKIEELSVLDIVEITGFIATKEIKKQAECPNCGAVNSRAEACVEAPDGKERSGGNEIFIYPIYINYIKNVDSDQEAYEYLHNRGEDVNKAFLLGNLTGKPVTGTLNEGRKIYTRYQLAINRKYCVKSGSEMLERTDYPWVYSYGSKAEDDYELLDKGSLVLIDGALQARKFTEQYICPHCGEEYNVRGRTLEILSYDTEYLRIEDYESKLPESMRIKKI